MSKIRKSARNEDCSVRLPSVCNFNPETTIFAHLGNSFSAANRSNDIHGCYCCSDCHDVIDGRRKTTLAVIDLQIAKYDAMMETQLKLMEKELLCIK